MIPTPVKGTIAQGGYLLSENENPTMTLIASGSEVELALNVQKALNEKGINANVVSVPCFDLFIEQEASYIDSIIIPNTKKIAIEASRSFEWYRFADQVIGMDSFGASAPADKLFKKFGFSVESIINKIS